jgi:subtilisin family serine protease
MRSFFVLTLLMISLHAEAAAVRTDTGVQAFLNSTGASNEKISVLLSYHFKPEVLSLKKISERERALIEHVQEQEEILFSDSLLLGSVKQTAWIANGTFVELDRIQLRRLLASSSLSSITSGAEIARIPELINSGESLGGPGFTWGLEKIGLPAVRAAYPNLDGSGIRLGILDTGIDGEHPDLKGKIKLFHDFVDPSNSIPRDDQGHGTHVAGTIAGGNASGSYIGVAPKVDFIVGKIFDKNGAAKTKDLILALQWIADPDGNPDTADYPQILSNSWTVGGKFAERKPADEPRCTVVENLTSLGVSSVFAAGNMGYQSASVQLPGACPAAFAVGATDASDQIAVFSSRGPANWLNGKFLKPDITAPGVDTISADPGGGYKSRSGTSMASPHVVGAMALLLQARPELSVLQLQESLKADAVDLGKPGADQDFGAGRMDLFKSLSRLMPR